MNISNQQQKFTEIFTKNSEILGTKNLESELNFLFFIEVPLLLKTQQENQEIVMQLQQEFPAIKSWKNSEELAITIALPGRMGTHFQGNQVNFMENALTEISQKFKKFEVQLANINCFPNSIFREILDDSGQIFKLHDEICAKIPFSQNPEFQYENFTPHVSLCLIPESINLDGKKLAKFRDILALNMEITQLNFGKINLEEDKIEKILLKTFELA
jgi:hypothetical protein